MPWRQYNIKGISYRKWNAVVVDSLFIYGVFVARWFFSPLVFPVTYRVMQSWNHWKNNVQTLVTSYGLCITCLQLPRDTYDCVQYPCNLNIDISSLTDIKSTPPLWNLLLCTENVMDALFDIPSNPICVHLYEASDIPSDISKYILDLNIYGIY